MSDESSQEILLRELLHRDPDWLLQEDNRAWFGTLLFMEQDSGED